MNRESLGFSKMLRLLRCEKDTAASVGMRQRHEHDRGSGRSPGESRRDCVMSWTGSWRWISRGTHSAKCDFLHCRCRVSVFHGID